jgi:hypothetical protein
MEPLAPEITEVSVVINGSFAPALFQPQWFARQNLFPLAEADNAKIGIVSNEVTQFTTERFNITAMPQQLNIRSMPGSIFDHVRDLIINTLFLLDQTPVAEMGVNRMMHFKMRSTDAWHTIGDTLAPKEIWEGLLPGRPGMETLTISGVKEGAPAGSKTNVRVEPSVVVPSGVFFLVNNNFTSTNKDEALPEFIAILKNDWSALQDGAADIAVNVIRRSEGK